MKNVGEFDKRNEEFNSKYSRDKIIKSSVSSVTPIIFDIGAHHGQSIDYLTKLFSKCLIYSFEPDPDSFKVLCKKESNTVKIFNLAISNNNGNINFYKNKISHTNSMYKVNINSKDSIRATRDRQLKQPTYEDDVNLEIVVKSVTLEKFISDYNIAHIDLVKIDVQGAESDVLIGANLSVIDSILVEVSLYDYYEKSTSLIDIEELLIPAGFRLFSILDISRNPMNGRTDWVELLYKKQR